jgi:Disulphide bond corrector protein DsbC
MILPLRFLIVAYWGFCPFHNFAQANQTVQWRFKYEYVNRQEAILSLTANVAPGWHLYSQYMEEGGPQRTHFIFEGNQDFDLVGNTRETGDRTAFRDETYEMEIAWFSGEVSFQQRIRFTKPMVKVAGKIEYMTCNNQVCVPAKQDFYFDLQPLKKKP